MTATEDAVFAELRSRWIGTGWLAARARLLRPEVVAVLERHALRGAVERRAAPGGLAWRLSPRRPR